MKTCLTFILSLLLLSGCMKDQNNTPEITVDYEIFGHVISYVEIGSKTGDSEWKSISDGQKLTFFSNSVDDKLGLPNNGKYLYIPSVGINLKYEAYFERIDSTIHILSATTGADAKILSYKLYDNSTLVISDTTITPSIKIKFRREN